MNSEEKLMAKKIEQANNDGYKYKNQVKKNTRVGSDNERKPSTKANMITNTSETIKPYLNNSEQSNNKNNDKSNDRYKQLFKRKKNSNKSSNKRVGSPATETQERVEEGGVNDAYYEKEMCGGILKDNLQINSNNKELLNQYPFPLTPLDKATNKPIEFEEDIAAVRSQSTRNK